MRRILVMGPPGAGKSTVASHLGARLGLPVFHLDQSYWRAGWNQAPANEFAAEVERIAELPAWVIDGNFTSTIVPRFRSADTVVFLDTPSWLSMVRIITRMVGQYGQVRPAMAADCPERFDLEFLRFAWAWNRDRRPRILALLEDFRGRTIVLPGRAAVRRLRDENPAGSIIGQSSHRRGADSVSEP